MRLSRTKDMLLHRSRNFLLSSVSLQQDISPSIILLTSPPPPPYTIIDQCRRSSSRTTRPHHLRQNDTTINHLHPSFASSSIPSFSSTAASQHTSAPPTSSPPLDFNNPQYAFKSKTTPQIIQSLLVFDLCRIKWLVKHADTILSTSKSIFGSTIVNWIVEKTFYKQFVAGPDAETIKPVLDALSTNGVHAILDYAAEDDVSESEGPKSRQQPHQSVVARTYSYEDEEVCNKRSSIFLKSIEAAAQSADNQGFAAIKVTALGNPMLLERISNALIAIKELFQQFDENGDGLIEKESFLKIYGQLFSDSNDERMNEIFDYLDVDHSGKIDYVEFTQRVTVKDGAAIAARCREQGPFSKAILNQEELDLLENMMKRVDALATTATLSGVRLMIDAEHTYFQPAIDAVVMELMRKHNKKEPIIYNTYQCYLKDVHERMAVDIERAKREGYKFGAKLVRGAYMVLERNRAQQMGYPSPIWDSLDDTHLAYNTAVSTMMMKVRDDGAEVMVASHNQDSIERAVAEMARTGLANSSPVAFGQLYGMADHLTFTLGGHGYRAYKYMPFGKVDEVIPYLVRRAQENSSVLGGVGIEMGMLRKELWRRLFTM